LTDQAYFEDDPGDEEFDSSIPGDSETSETWPDEDDGVVYQDLSFEQARLEDSLGRALNGTETMALQNALDQGVEGTLSELYDMYREIRGTPEGREALMKARLQDLREES
jgi:hypothetical protein